MQLKLDWFVLLENLRRGILVTDVNLEGPRGPRIIYANRAWLEMTGYQRDELAGLTLRVLHGKHSDRAVLALLKEKPLKREIFHGQTWNYRKDGRPFMMNWYCYPMHLERSTPANYVAEQEDVTEMDSLRMRQRLLDESPGRRGQRVLRHPASPLQTGETTGLTPFAVPQPGPRAWPARPRRTTEPS